MVSLILLLLDAWPVSYGQALLERLKTYDILAHEVVVEPGEDGLAVDCRMTIRVEHKAPLRFLFSSDVRDLEVTQDGAPVAATMGSGGFETALRLMAGDVRGVPSLLTIAPRAPPEKGSTVQYRLRYRWRPAPGGWDYATRDAVQTHLSPFWLPTMADELFDAQVTVKTKAQAFAPGTRSREGDHWRFVSAHPVQIVPLVVGRFRATGGRVYLPRGVRASGQRLLEDLERVTAQLEAWFGPSQAPPLRLLVEPRVRFAPSFCAGSFVVVDRRYLPGRAGRKRWLSHLAHECAHVWWGHRVATTVVGQGGTWLREGLAEWSGVEVAGALLGEETGAALHRDRFRIYIRRIDLRRAGTTLFANEATLRDATYLDDPAVPYLRGALVLRLLAHTQPDFRASLRRFAQGHAFRFATQEDFVSVVGGGEVVAYYADTTRVPDLELRDVSVTGTRLDARIRCADSSWPGGVVPVSIQTSKGAHQVSVPVRAGVGMVRWQGEEPPVRVEIDPERYFLDPIRSNNVWSKN